MRKDIGRRSVLGAAAVALATPALAQGVWPDRPIRIVVPFPPGAFNDALGRIVADRMPELLGQPGVVENRPGAGGSVGSAAVARSPADGYTLLVGNTANLAFNPFIYTNPGYDPVKDFTPVGTCARLANVLVVNAATLPVRNVAELVARAREAPGKLVYASSGAGSSPHLAAELFRQKAGIDITHAPYRGSAPAVNDLLAGNVAIMFDNVPNLLPHLEAGGRLRALAVTGTTRDPALPDVPTLQEAGIAGYEMYVWFGLLAPAGLPVPIQRRLFEAVRTIIGMPVTEERLRRLGAEPWVQGPDRMATEIRAEQEKWGPVIRAAEIRAD